MDPSGSIDALFVINQDAGVDLISDTCRRHGLKSILALSTHHLFAGERKAFSSQPGIERIVFREFGELLTDAEMEWCDDEATRLLCDGDAGEAAAHYAVAHMAKSRYLKNSSIHRAISREYRIPRVFFTPGIGVDGAYWRSVADSTEIGGRRRPSTLRRLARRLKQRVRVPRLPDVVIAESGEKRLFMLADTARLHPVLPEGARKIRIAGRPRLPARKRPLEIYRRLIASHAGPGKRNVVCTTIHQYDPGLSSLGCPIEIFVDGYQPSNYPRAYLDGYTEGSFVVRDMFDAAWFEKHGRSVVRPYAFLRPVEMEPPRELEHGVRSIYLMLNHAGDWSALINRSDTDIVVERFFRIARDNPRVKAVVRCHPTMAREEHEGEGSLERIRRFVDGAGLPNLRLSAASLAEEMADADLIVSEYSNVILDGFKAGTLGVIANCTRRRNFMQDYTDLGFVTAPSAAELVGLVNDVVADPRPYLQQQKLAASRYNERLVRFLRGQPARRATQRSQIPSGSSRS